MALRLTGLGRLLQSVYSLQGAVLMLHRVQPNKGSSFNPNGMLAVEPEFLDALCVWLVASRYDVVSIDEGISRLRSGHTSGKPFVVLTFDDGYLDNLTEALPIMERHGLPFTMYSATGLIEGTSTLWWAGLEWTLDAVDELVCDFGAGMAAHRVATPGEKCAMFHRLMDHCTKTLDEKAQRQFVLDLCERHGLDLKARTLAEMMTMEQLRQFASHPLVTIGAHTVNHFALGRLAPDHARREVVAGAEVLAAVTGQRPRHFAYPYGNRIAAGPREFEMLAELGFDSAVTTRRGALYRGHENHLTALPRLSVNGHFQSLPFTRQWVTGSPALVHNRLRAIDSR